MKEEQVQIHALFQFRKEQRQNNWRNTRELWKKVFKSYDARLLFE